MASMRLSLATNGWSRGCPAGLADGTAGAQSWMVQFASASFTSERRPAVGRTSTARSGAPSPLKSPTSPSSRSGSTARPNARTTAARTSCGRAGVKSASTTAGRKCSAAAGDGGRGSSTCGRRARERVVTRAVVLVAMSPPGTRGPAGGRPAPFTVSEGIEERDELVLLGRAEELVVEDHGVGLARVAQDGLVAGERLAVVHQPIAAAHAPQGRRAHLVARGLTAVLDDSVPRADVVQEEIAE